MTDLRKKKDMEIGGLHTCTIAWGRSPPDRPEWQWRHGKWSAHKALPCSPEPCDQLTPAPEGWGCCLFSSQTIQNKKTKSVTNTLKEAVDHETIGYTKSLLFASKTAVYRDYLGVTGKESLSTTQTITVSTIKYTRSSIHIYFLSVKSFSFRANYFENMKFSDYLYW